MNIDWLLSPEGRMIAAAAIFLLLWALKNTTLKYHLLKSDRGKLLANVLVSLASALPLLVDQGVPSKEAWLGVLNIILVSMGLQGGAKAALGESLKNKFGLGTSTEKSEEE